MEKQKYKLRFLTFAFFIIFVANSVSSQQASRKIIYKAYIDGDMNKWLAVMNTIEKNGDTKSVEQKIELINYYYGYIGYLLGIKKFEQAQKMIDKADIIINDVLSVRHDNSTGLAYKGSFTGFRIALSKFKAITLGPVSASYINKALEKDKNNIQATVDKGNIYFYTPPVFGGNKSEAIKLYKYGIELLEKSGNTQNNWFYLSVLTTLAKAYEKINKPQDALTVYRKILKIEPEFSWVKNDLMPELMKKLNQ